MSHNADSHALQSRSFLGEVEDFGQSALHAAIENPINGCIQIIDHAANKHLPELKIIGEPTHNSFGAKAGAIVGTAADIICISVLTGGAADILGGAGLAGGIATAAATGAIYGGILTPSDNNSKHFVKDRLSNSAIGAATFATMNGAAGLLGATGIWAAPEARSLAGSLSFGGLSGAAGGAVSAETAALLKEGKALPSSNELLSSITTNAAFGAAYGGLGYAYNRTLGTEKTEITTDKGKISNASNANGYDRIMSDGTREVSNAASGQHHFDATGRTIEFADSDPLSINGANLTYDSSGALDRVYFGKYLGMSGHSMQRIGDNLWQYTKGDDVYNWKGSIETVEDPASGTVNGLTLQPEGGKPISYDSNTSPATALSQIRSTGTYDGIRPELGYARATEDGSVVLKGVPKQHLTVNGQEADGEVAVKPGDDVRLRVDVGGEFPNWQNTQINIGTSPAGRTTVAGTEVSGNRPLNLNKLAMPEVPPYHPPVHHLSVYH